MFNFLNSAVLIAAAAALIPLLIHLFSRRKVKVVSFSSLKHLKEMQKRQVRRIKIRQLLLLLLRMLIILVAVLAFARPATKGGYLGSHAGVSSVVLLDRSASMKRQNKDGVLFDLASQKAEEILNSFGQSDEVILIPYDKTAYFPSGRRFFSKESALDILKGTEAGYNTADLGEAFSKGVELLNEAKNLNKELYIISDRQLNSLPDEIGPGAASITTYLVDLPLEIDGNCGVDNIDLGGQLIEVGSDFEITANIKNYDSRDKSELLASLFVDGVRVMQKEFTIDADGNQSVPLQYKITRAGFHSGWIEISDDDFLPDNRYYFTFRIPEKFNVLVIDGDGGGEIVRMALVPSDEVARYWSVKSITPDKLASVRFTDYDIVIASGPVSLGGPETSRLFDFVDGGGGLFYIFGQKTDPDYFNREFGRRLGMELVKPIPDRFGGAGYYTFERIDYGHPIFEPFASLFEGGLPNFKFYVLAGFEKNSDENCLAYFSNGQPALVEAGLGLGKIIFLASPVLPEITDIAGHSFFVPFIIRTAEYLASDMSKFERRYYVGQSIIRTVSDHLDLEGTAQLITPDDNIYQIAGIQKPGQLAYDCRPINIPGIYKLEANNRLIDLFPVNMPREEGNLQAADPDRLMASLGIREYKQIPYGTKAETVITESRYGRELWKLFLWAVAVLLIVEMLFSREKSVVENES